MSNFPGSFGTSRGRPLDYSVGDDAQVLVRFFSTVYAWMATGLALTGSVAWISASYPQSLRMLNGPMMSGLIIVELVLVVAISGAVNRINATVATGLFLLYAAINGVLFSTIFLAYTQTSIAGT